MVVIRKGNIQQRAKELDAMGTDYICTHTDYDLQTLGKTPFNEFNTMKSGVKATKVAMAGSIKTNTAEQAVNEKPELLIVGSRIATANDPAKNAREIKDIMNKD